jgi:hypothetical protein
MNEARSVKVIWPFFVEVCVFKAGEEYTTIIFWIWILHSKKQVLIMELSDLALEKTSVEHGIHELSDLALERQVLIIESMN